MSSPAKPIRLNILLPPEAAAALAEVATKEGVSRSKLLADMVLRRQKELREQQFLAQLDAYYSDPECRAFEEELCREWDFANASIDRVDDDDEAR